MKPLEGKKKSLSMEAARKMTREEVLHEVDKIKAELYDMRVKSVTDKIDKPHVLKMRRHDLARLRLALKEREMISALKQERQDLLANLEKKGKKDIKVSAVPDIVENPNKVINTLRKEIRVLASQVHGADKVPSGTK